MERAVNVASISSDGHEEHCGDIGVLGDDSAIVGAGPAWARTTITLSNVESVSCGRFNGLKCRIGPEEPPLVHNSYTAEVEPAAPSLTGSG